MLDEAKSRRSSESTDTLFIYVHVTSSNFHCSPLINMLPFSRLKFLNISSSSGILALQNGRNVQALRKTFSAGARAGPK